MKHTLALVLMVFGISGCSTDNSEIRLTCDCLHEIDGGSKSACDTNKFAHIKKNISFVINEKDKSFTFNGIEYQKYDRSFSSCLELVDGIILFDTEDCSESYDNDSGKIAAFDNNFIRYFMSASILGGTTIVFDRTSLIFKKQHFPIEVVFPDGAYNPKVVEQKYIRPEYSYEYYQCKIVTGA